MAEFYRFFDSTLDDIREYTADEYAEYFRMVLTSGIYNGGTNLQAYSKGTSMSVDIKDGFACINGYLYKVQGGVSVKLATADVTYDRIDRIVIRWDKREESRYIKAMVVKGTPSANPVAPAIKREGEIYDLSLAQVRVKAGTSYVVSADITDERLNTTVCGLVNSLVQADTTEIFNQFKAWYDLKIPEFEKQWTKWFDKQQLKGFVTNEEIDGLKKEVETVIQEANVTNTLKVIKSGKDSEGVYTVVTYKRKADDTTYCVSTLSGGTSPLYTTRTEKYYDVTGTSVVATHTFTLSYDEDENLISEV